jgi:phosphoglycerate dehydrogenase-like enzyme
MNPIRVALIGRMASGGQDELARRLRVPHEIFAIPDTTRLDEFAADLESAEVLTGWPLTMDVVRRAPNVRLVQAFGAGVDGLRFEELDSAVRVANTFHHEAAIAEHVMMAMLLLSRRPLDDDARLRQGNWERSVIWGEPPVLRELRGQSVLLIGIGHIARELAVRARAFAMRVMGASRSGTKIPAAEHIPWDRWQDALGEADFVVPTCPLTPDTEGLIGAAQLERMKPSAFLINITRGRVVEEEPLYEALRTGRIAGAALDVWYQYPSAKDETRLPSRFPFHELPNVFMTPHNCGWTDRTLAGRIVDVAENINRLAEGRPLINLLR